jgi:hypothetical protein
VTLSKRRGWCVARVGKSKREAAAQRKGDRAECALQVRLFRHSGVAAEERYSDGSMGERESRGRCEGPSILAGRGARAAALRRGLSAKRDKRATLETVQTRRWSGAVECRANNSPGCCSLIRCSPWPNPGGRPSARSLQRRNTPRSRPSRRSASRLRYDAASAGCAHCTTRWGQRRAMQKPLSTAAAHHACAVATSRFSSTVRVAMLIRICSCLPSSS